MSSTAGCSRPTTRSRTATRPPWFMDAAPARRPSAASLAGQSSRRDALRASVINTIARAEGERDDRSGTWWHFVLDALRGQVDHILDACTRCGKCVEACPMVEPAGLDPTDSVVIADGVLDLLAGGVGNKAAERWAQVWTNSGKCIPACDYGINPRFMVNMA